ncbi:hypothetical protein EKO27_g2009 [Xylaria grammica]|uniref:Uncharacterized protein n=1 Tax=Xylaria grammica TaxID=363999 RepID=A0A439DFB6_9PEZI|nr:hypothetical protein EKO27_g2009 [Xylaria grammica]
MRTVLVLKLGGTIANPYVQERSGPKDPNIIAFSTRTTPKYMRVVNIYVHLRFTHQLYTPRAQSPRPYVIRRDELLRVSSIDALHGELVRPTRTSRSLQEYTDDREAQFNDMSPPIRIAVIGAGVAGASLLRALIKFPHLDVHIFESAATFQEAGTAIGIARSAQSALGLIGPSAARCLERARGVRFILATGKAAGSVVDEVDDVT